MPWYAFDILRLQVMKLKRLVIAVNEPVLAQVLQTALGKDYAVSVCENGNELPAVLEELRPEALILNLFQRKTDGIRVLEQTRYQPPVILAFTYVLNDSLIIDAHRAGICELLLLPCSRTYMLQRFQMHMTRFDQLKGGM